MGGLLIALYWLLGIVMFSVAIIGIAALGWAVYNRATCVVCRGGGHPADYPRPRIDALDAQYRETRMCPKHFGQYLKFHELEKRSGS